MSTHASPGQSEPSSGVSPAQSGRGRSGRALLATWVPTIVFGAILPLFTFLLLSGQGVSDVLALTVAAFWPLLELVVFYAIHKRVDEFGVVIVIYLAISIVVALLFASPRLLLIRDSALTGLLGLAMLASLTMPRPMGFYFGRKFGTDGSAAGVQWWNGLWRHRSFRRSQYVITAVWGATFTAEAVVRILLTFVLPVPAMAVISFVSPIVVIPALVTFTVVYARRTRAAAGRPVARARADP